MCVVVSGVSITGTWAGIGPPLPGYARTVAVRIVQAFLGLCSSGGTGRSSADAPTIMHGCCDSWVVVVRVVRAGPRPAPTDVLDVGGCIGPSLRCYGFSLLGRRERSSCL